MLSIGGFQIFRILFVLLTIDNDDINEFLLNAFVFEYNLYLMLTMQLIGCASWIFGYTVSDYCNVVIVLGVCSFTMESEVVPVFFTIFE